MKIQYQLYFNFLTIKTGKTVAVLLLFYLVDGCLIVMSMVTALLYEFIKLYKFGSIIQVIKTMEMNINLVVFIS